MQDGWKAVWSITYVSVAFFPSLKQNFIAYCSSKVSSCPDYIFEIHQLWQSGFSRVYSNCCCSCSFECEIIKIGQSSHNMYINNILNFQESTTILNTCTKKSGNYWMHHVSTCKLDLKLKRKQVTIFCITTKIDKKIQTRFTFVSTATASLLRWVIEYFYQKSSSSSSSSSSYYYYYYYYVSFSHQH